MPSVPTTNGFSQLGLCAAAAGAVVTGAGVAGCAEIAGGAAAGGGIWTGRAGCHGCGAATRVGTGDEADSDVVFDDGASADVTDGAAATTGGACGTSGGETAAAGMASSGSAL